MKGHIELVFKNGTSMSKVDCTDIKVARGEETEWGSPELRFTDKLGMKWEVDLIDLAALGIKEIVPACFRPADELFPDKGGVLSDPDNIKAYAKQPAQEPYIDPGEIEGRPQ